MIWLETALVRHHIATGAGLSPSRGAAPTAARSAAASAAAAAALAAAATASSALSSFSRIAACSS